MEYKLFRYSSSSASKISAPNAGFELREGSKVTNFLVQNFDLKTQVGPSVAPRQNELLTSGLDSKLSSKINVKM